MFIIYLFGILVGIALFIFGSQKSDDEDRNSIYSFCFVAGCFILFVFGFMIMNYGFPYVSAQSYPNTTNYTTTYITSYENLSYTMVFGMMLCLTGLIFFILKGFEWIKEAYGE